MNTALNTFNNILNVDLRPWIVNYSPQKYEQELATIKKESYQFQPLYEVDFPKPLNEKRKYYHTVIEKAAITFLNGIHTQIETASNEQEKTYWVFMALKRQLPSKFSAVNNLIERKNYQFANITRTNDDAYIIQYLKYQLIRLYLEVQDSYPNQVKDQPLTEKEILESLFSEPPFDKPFINKAAKQNLPDAKPNLSIQPEEPSFTPLKRDFRQPKKGVMQYSDIIKDANRFARFEEELVQNKFIDRNYNYSNPERTMQEMGGIYQVLIKKGYFLERNFTLNKRITPRAISMFLDHRYNTSLDKQFRYWNDKPQELDDLREKYYWLDNLPLC